MEIKKCWYKEMTVYQIWPRSFKDGNGDGIGDLKGVLEKLDYLKWLGIDAIWFSPVYKSPQCDFGYDIADYRNIAPEYGTLDDFKAVLKGCKERGIKVIMDLVVNHTSTEHEWFRKSRMCGDDNPYKDYYFWRKGTGKDGKGYPNNWTSSFPGPAWTWDDERKEYYLHLFAVGQPDLNHDNPKVRQEVIDIYKYWLDMGVDGFREDVITYISKEKGLPNGNPLSPVMRGVTHYNRGPHLHEYLQQFKNEGRGKYDCMNVGEAPGKTPDNALEFIKEGDKQDLKMMFHFQHMEADCIGNACVHTGFKLKKLKKVMSTWQDKMYGVAWNANYMENHDQPRSVSRFGDEKRYHDLSAKVLANSYFFLSGTPFVYQGQEIGMTSIYLKNMRDYVDVAAFCTHDIMKKLGLPEKLAMKMLAYGSRDNARTPVQWTDGKCAGFTTADRAWFHINKNYKDINVESQIDDENSVLNYYRELIRIRKENPIIIYGDYKLHYKNSKNLWVYERNYEGKRMLVVLNFSDKAVRFKAPEGFDLEKGKLLIGNYKDNKVVNNGFVTRPWEARTYIFG